jgi:hypothetical protein
MAKRTRFTFDIEEAPGQVEGRRVLVDADYAADEHLSRGCAPTRMDPGEPPSVEFDHETFTVTRVVDKATGEALALTPTVLAAGTLACEAWVRANQDYLDERALTEAADAEEAAEAAYWDARVDEARENR